MEKEKNNIIEFPDKKEEPSMSPEDLKLLIDQNEYIKMCLKVMNDIPLMDETPVDYMELWNKVSLQKKVDAGDVNPDAIAFYFQLLSTGYDNFGAMFFHHFANSENAAYFYYAIKCFLQYMTDTNK